MYSAFKKYNRRIGANLFLGGEETEVLHNRSSHSRSFHRFLLIIFKKKKKKSEFVDQRTLALV